MSLEVGVVRFPGTNCETETVRALAETLPGASVRLVDHRETCLDALDAVVLPGGFSYGDYLRAGAIAARSPVGQAVRDLAARGAVVVGICNGLQQLQELGLLPGALVRNRQRRFYCGTVHVRVDGRPSALTCALEPGTTCRLPVAHGQGRFHAAADELRELEASGRVVLRYVDERGALDDGANPNGSAGAVAGLCNERGNVVGFMPHPERNADRLQGTGEGARFLSSIARFIEQGGTR